jgi:hypothetical protein
LNLGDKKVRLDYNDIAMPTHIKDLSKVHFYAVSVFKDKKPEFFADNGIIFSRSLKPDGASWFFYFVDVDCDF